MQFPNYYFLMITFAHICLCKWTEKHKFCCFISQNTLEGTRYQCLSTCHARRTDYKHKETESPSFVRLFLSLSLTAHNTSMVKGWGGLGKTSCGPTERALKELQLKTKMLENNSRFLSLWNGITLMREKDTNLHIQIKTVLSFFAMLFRIRMKFIGKYVYTHKEFALKLSVCVCV